MKLFHLSVLVILSAVLMGCNTGTNLTVNEQVAVPETNENTLASQGSEWKTYSNDEFGFSFEYPKDWPLSEQTGNFKEIVSVISPAHQELQKTDWEGGYYRIDFAVSFCENINTDCARGGEWVGVRHYADIPDMLKEGSAMKHKSDVMSSALVDGIESYGVISGGFGANYEIMVPHRGVYLLDFPSTETTLSEEQQKILASFRFID